MLYKNTKLSNSDDFSSVFSSKNRLSSLHFHLYYQYNNLNYYRYGYIVSRKIEKSAVIRNYIKRVIRETFKNDFSESFNVDMVIKVKKTFNNNDFSVIKLELNNLFLKIKK